MIPPAVFPFVPRPGGLGPGDTVPLLTVRLSTNGVVFDATGLVDTGATFSVLPLDVGARFGVDWNRLTRPLAIGGAFGPVPARLLPVDAVVGPFPPVKLLFAWARSNAVPVLFGQTNFFDEFDVCFFRRRGEFHLQPATP